MTDRATKTTKIELVETHNLALSFNRLTGAPYDSGGRWRRALYHALGISGVADRELLKHIRVALRLP